MTYEEVWGWATFLAAFLAGIGAGWLGAVLWWNAEAKKVRPKPDPLGLESRFKQAVLDGKPIVLVGDYEITPSQPKDRYQEIKYEWIGEDA